MYQILNIVCMHLLGTKEYRNGWQNKNWTFFTRKDRKVNHVQLSSRKFHLAASQARKMADLADSLETLLLSVVSAFVHQSYSHPRNERYDDLTSTSL
jgi:hypothetical protein